MTAKHRRPKNNHKHEDNFFKNDLSDTEVRTGGNNYALLLVLFLMFVVGGATGAWFCFQQHQTLTYLTDNLMGMQMKIVKLQSSHEELRRSNSKPVSDNVETRLNALEESYALAQKQVGMALATAEQLKTSDLPAQVLSLHTEMKTRMSEMQQATVSLDQLSQLQSMLQGKSEEFDGVRIQVEGLASLTGELSQKVDVLTGSLGHAESELEERAGQVAALSTNMDGQALEVLRLKHELSIYQAQLEASVKEMAAVRELLEKEDAQRLQQASVEQQLNTPEGSETEAPAEVAEETKDPAGEAVEEVEEEEEEEGLAAAEEAEEQEKAVEQDAAPVEQEHSVEEETAATEEAAPEEATPEQVNDIAAEEPSVEEEAPAEGVDEGGKVEEEAPAEEESAVEEVAAAAEEEEEEEAAAPEVEEENTGEEEEEEEPQEEEESLEEEASPQE